MKLTHFGRRFLSTLLAICLIATLLPAMPVAAAKVDKPAELPDDFHGYYLQYGETTLHDTQNNKDTKAAVVSLYAYNIDH